MTADPVGFRPFHNSCKSTCELRVQREVVVNFVKGWDAVFMSQSTGSGGNLLFVVCGPTVASFPGPAQLSIACSTEKR